MGNRGDLHVAMTQGSRDMQVSIETPNGSVTLPDLSGLANVNSYDHDTKTCRTSSNRYNPGNCANSTPSASRAYVQTYDSWYLNHYASLVSYLDQLNATGDYNKGAEVSASCSLWASTSLQNLGVYRDWIANMQGKLNKENRCCRDRTGSGNFANGVVPNIDELEGKLLAFESTMTAYKFGFDGLPPPAPDPNVDPNLPEPNVGPNTEGNGGKSNGQDSGDLRKFLIAGGGVLVLLTVIVIFARRRK